MKILITAGNTQTPIDSVRCITNIFTGRTGAQIAETAFHQGHEVALLTSHPDTVSEAGIAVKPYRTFDDLRTLMENFVPGNRFDALIHAAAVSDFAVEQILVPDDATSFDPSSLRWSGETMCDASSGKIKSQHRELWLRLTPTPKLADLVRTTWAFRGTFVKFKLEVNKANAELQTIATHSRRQSDADWIVANTLEERATTAWIGDREDRFERVPRACLAEQLLAKITTDPASAAT